MDTEPEAEVWWHIPVVPVLRRLLQVDQKFKTSLGYVVKEQQQNEKQKPGFRGTNDLPKKTQLLSGRDGSPTEVL